MFQNLFSERFLIRCLNSSNEKYTHGGGSCSCDNAYSSCFSVAYFDRLFFALALVLGRGRFNVDRALSFNDLRFE